MIKTKMLMVESVQALMEEVEVNLLPTLQNHQIRVRHGGVFAEMAGSLAGQQQNPKPGTGADNE